MTYLVVIHVRPHQTFTREGNDIYTHAKISFIQAALGTTIEVKNIDDVQELNVPAGTQYGEQLRIKGKGMPRYRSSYDGDLVVQIEIETPRKLSTQQRTLLEHFDDPEYKPDGSENSSVWEKLFGPQDDK